MRRITPQYKKNINYTHWKKYTKIKSTLFLAVSFFFCRWKNSTVYFFFVDFFSCGFFFLWIFYSAVIFVVSVEFFYCG